jgi:hypothetical protein
MPLARASLIEFPADDPERARRFLLAAVLLGAEVWAICRDSEGSPFALAQESDGA